MGRMEWVIAVVVIVALGIAAAAAAGGMGEMAAEPVRDIFRQPLPQRPLTAADLGSIRFGVSLRGYAMGQVDDLLDRLARELAERDALIGELTGEEASVVLHGRAVALDPGTACGPESVAGPGPTSAVPPDDRTDDAP